MIKTIIFDLEGVIIDTEPVWDQTDLIFISRRGVEGPGYPERYRESLKPLLMGRSLADGLADGAEIIRDYCGFGGDPQKLAQERREIAKELLQHATQFIPGFEEFFEQIREKFIRGIATSLERDFLATINERFNLTGLFGDNIFSIQDIGYISKPNPDIFLYAAKMLESEPSSCLVIEDAPNGVQAAKSAGMHCIAITTSTTRERLSGADLIINSYQEIDFSRFL